ncbi:hypothetical protein BDB01DRAFT_373890 [Pilobolus umbonatus]|nr:hypothetical protein BDB01DRAFT_373890 [Pilobolus umbonatus]
MSSPSNPNSGLHRSLSGHLQRLHIRTGDGSQSAPDISEHNIGVSRRLTSSKKSHSYQHQKSFTSESIDPTSPVYVTHNNPNSSASSSKSSSASFLSRKMSSKRDRSNSVGRTKSSTANASPLTTNKIDTANSGLYTKYSNQSDGTSCKSDESGSNNSTPQLSPSKDLPSSAFGKARDRTTFKGVIDKFVGSFNGNLFYYYFKVSRLTCVDNRTLE